MSEVERRRAYNAQRVLISSVAVLNPTFDDGDLYFTGPQIEIMRNLVQYANRPENYAAEWELGYYLIPDNDDWDDIQAIVADMEETLMGNPNTLWGYHDRLYEFNEHQKVGAGSYTLEVLEVPAGHVYVVNSIVSNSVGTALNHQHQVCLADSCVTVYQETQTASAVLVINTGISYVLAAGDKVKIIYAAAQDADYLVARVWGYMMLVP